MEASIINDVNEPVYLLESGWIPSSCYTVNRYTHQVAEEGRPTIVMQFNAHHHGINHGNHGQFLLLSFSGDVPDGATMMMNGYPIEFYPGSRTLARGTTGWHQNTEEDIGAGDLTLSFSFPDDWSMQQMIDYANGVNGLLINLEFTDWSFRDYV